MSLSKRHSYRMHKRIHVCGGGGGGGGGGGTSCE